MVFLALVTNSPAGQVYAMIYGIFSSLALPLETIMLSLITSDLFGNKSFEKILGIISALNTAGYAVGAPLMNWCYDAYGTYVPFIWVSVGIMVVVTVMFQFIISASQKERKRTCLCKYVLSSVFAAHAHQEGENKQMLRSTIVNYRTFL
jgi:MFS family permease